MTIRFANKLKFADISKFRGAVASELSSGNLLFHNHTDNGFRYSYPLIQYKRINGKAAIVCIGEGADIIGDFFNNINQPLSIGSVKSTLTVASIKAYKTNILVINKETFEAPLLHHWFKTYSLRKWIPLNDNNYTVFQQIKGLKERYAMLEKILVGNILSFAKGIHITLEGEIVCSITGLEEKTPIKYKGVPFSTFDVCFSCNVLLPDFIGLGKGVSHGFGMLTACK